MAVLQIKPHRLSYYVEEGGYNDTNGDYHRGPSRWEGDIHCDAVPAGAGSEMQFEDGVTRKYSYTVYLPKNCRDFAIGEKVKISLYNGVVRTFDVKGFHRYQMQCKLWV